MNHKSGKPIPYVHEGVEYASARACSRATGIPVGTLYYRRNMAIPPEKWDCNKVKLVVNGKTYDYVKDAAIEFNYTPQVLWQKWKLNGYKPLTIDPDSRTIRQVRVEGTLDFWRDVNRFMIQGEYNTLQELMKELLLDFVEEERAKESGKD